MRPKPTTFRLMTLAILLASAIPAHGQDAPARAAKRGETYAFLVAASEYDQKELRQLKYSRNDIQSFYEELLKGGVEKSNIVLMHEGRGRRYLPEARKIREELALLLKGLRHDDELIIALAGHGIQFKGEAQSYFCPVDARLSDRKTLIALDHIYQQANACKAGRKLILVDACRNDPQSDLSRSRAVVDLESVTRPQTQSVPEGIMALFSCSAGERSFEHPNLKHGVFFYHFLQGWRGQADDNKDGKLTLTELSDFTRKQTQTYARLELAAVQRPHMKIDLSGEWVLREISHVESDEIRRFAGHGSILRTVAFSPDGETALTAGGPGGRAELNKDADYTIRLWNRRTGSELLTLEGDASTVPSARFRPDGRQILAGHLNGTLQLWDTATGRKIRRFSNDSQPIIDAVFSKSGKIIYTCGPRHAVAAWNANTGRKLYSSPKLPGAGILRLSPDGRTILAGGYDRVLRLLDARTGKLVREFKGHGQRFVALAFSLDGRQIYAALRNGQVWVWNTDNGRFKELIKGPPGRTTAAAFSEDLGSALFCIDDEKVARIVHWDLHRESEIARFSGHSGTITSIAFSPDQRAALSGSVDRTARLWKLR